MGTFLFPASPVVRNTHTESFAISIGGFLSRKLLNGLRQLDQGNGVGAHDSPLHVSQVFDELPLDDFRTSSVKRPIYP